MHFRDRLNLFFQPFNLAVELLYFLLILIFNRFHLFSTFSFVFIKLCFQLLHLLRLLAQFVFLLMSQADLFLYLRAQSLNDLFSFLILFFKFCAFETMHFIELLLVARLSTLRFLLVVIVGVYQDSDVSLDLAILTSELFILVLPFDYVFHCFICLAFYALHVLSDINHCISEIHQFFMLFTDAVQLLLHLWLLAPCCIKRRLKALYLSFAFFFFLEITLLYHFEWVLPVFRTLFHFLFFNDIDIVFFFQIIDSLRHILYLALCLLKVLLQFVNFNLQILPHLVLLLVDIRYLLLFRVNLDNFLLQGTNLFSRLFKLYILVEMKRLYLLLHRHDGSWLDCCII